jgi:hypothetical protein
MLPAAAVYMINLQKHNLVFTAAGTLPAVMIEYKIARLVPLLESLEKTLVTC